MSLLLDALKKAAQKKADKSAQLSEGAKTGDEKKLELNQQDDTALNDTDAVDFETSLENKDYESSLQEDDTSITDGVTFDADPTNSDSVSVSASAQPDQDTQFTDLDSTPVDEGEKIELKNDEESSDTQLTEVASLNEDPMQLDGAFLTGESESTSERPRVDLDTQFTQTTELESTSIGDTEHKEESFDTILTDVIAEDESSTQLEEISEQHEPVTEPDNTPESTETVEIESIFALSSALDNASQDTIADDNDPTKVGDYVQMEDTTEMDVTSIDRTEIGDDTVLGHQSQLAEEDRTLYIYDGANPSLSSSTDKDVFPFLAVEGLYRNKSNLIKDDLTEDDVTHFMGDGVSRNSSYNPEKDITESLKSDDTSVTNPESLTMTNFSFEDSGESQVTSGEALKTAQNFTENDTFSLHEYDNRTSSEQTVTNSISLEDIPEDDKSTRINTDSTSTVSSIDIEQLTSDGVVTLGSTNTNRTYAPDNYDRTLLNLSEKDVSNIFPGVRPDADTVMTPDYAKRIFLSKSGQVKTRYYKLYASIGLILLLSVVTWGLFQLEVQSGEIDQKLAKLKRDPLPGIIRSQTGNSSERLFVPAAEGTGLKSVDIISRSAESYIQPEAEQSESAVSSQQTVIETVEEEIASMQADSDRVLASSEIKPAAKVASAPVKTASTSTLSISSGTRTSRKSEILMQAYNAYEQGNMASARLLYNKVLKLDESDRDGILGRAAVHIQDNEYQQAIDKYQQLLVSNPKDSIAVASLISVANIEPQAGETQLKSLLREQPDAAYLHFILGNMYGGQNRWHDAQTAYFDALQHKPDDANYAYNLAVSLEHIGKVSAAINFYKKALDNSSGGLITFDDQLVMQRLEVLAQ